jgi:hypothetical protein
MAEQKFIQRFYLVDRFWDEDEVNEIYQCVCVCAPAAYFPYLMP